jgi:hypothetical protein
MEQTAPPPRRFSPLLFAVIMVALLVALVCIYLGLAEWINGDPSNTASLYISTGIVTLAVATYMMYQTRKRIARIMSLEMQPLSSTVQCMKCGFKNVREFKRGDFVFKETDEVCPKDNLKMTISAIYREVKDKEKAKEDAY